MIITILISLILVICIIAQIYIKTTNKDTWVDDLDLPTLVGAVISGGALILMIFVIVLTHATADIEAEENRIRRTTLVAEYEATNNTEVGPATIVMYNEIQDKICSWNIECVEAQYYSKSPWVNWFYDEKVVDSLKYIDVEVK